MKKLNIFFMLLLPLCICGQQKVEIGGFMGLANYQGDLAPDPLVLSETKYSFGAFARYHYSDKVKIKANAMFGFISGSDLNDNNGGLRARGWSFESNLFEFSVVGEYHPLGKSRFGETGVFEKQISPYGFAGVGFVHSDPSIMTTRIEDASLFPENDFSPTHLTIPFGLGIRADIFEFASLGVEGGWRFTNNDYLDGVKQNGNPDGRDLYMFVGATLSFFLGAIEGFNF